MTTGCGKNVGATGGRPPKNVNNPPHPVTLNECEGSRGNENGRQKRAHSQRARDDRLTGAKTNVKYGRCALFNAPKQEILHSAVATFRMTERGKFRLKPLKTHPICHSEATPKNLVGTNTNLNTGVLTKSGRRPPRGNEHEFKNARTNKNRSPHKIG